MYGDEKGDDLDEQAARNKTIVKDFAIHRYFFLVAAAWMSSRGLACVCSMAL